MAIDDGGAGSGNDTWGDLLATSQAEVAASWLTLLGSDAPAAASTDVEDLAAALAPLLAGTGATLSLDDKRFDRVRQLVSDTAARRGRAGASATSTASFVLTFRDALLAVAEGKDLHPSLAEVRKLANFVDALTMLTLDVYVQARQEVISQQGQQLLELSTPVVRLWDRVVAAPLIGTLDSARAQVVMETLLEAIVSEDALVAILDITGVPTVDTLVAQHLLKTVAATRLMGAECIVSGIRPQTAQTIVQLGIDLTEVTTRASLADALSTAIDRVNARGEGAGRR